MIGKVGDKVLWKKVGRIGRIAQSEEAIPIFLTRVAFSSGMEEIEDSELELLTDDEHSAT